MIQLEKAQKLYKNDSAFKEFVDYVAKLRQNVTETALDHMGRLLQETGLERDQVREVMKKLEGVGAGEYRIGRRGKPTRFLWTVASREFAESLTSGNTTRPSVVPTSGFPHVDPSMPASPTFSHVFQLRADLRVKIELPQDLTPAEAERLATFVKSLPFL
jgi:hypothetical protein